MRIFFLIASLLFVFVLRIVFFDQIWVQSLPPHLSFILLMAIAFYFPGVYTSVAVLILGLIQFFLNPVYGYRLFWYGLVAFLIHRFLRDYLNANPVVLRVTHILLITLDLLIMSLVSAVGWGAAWIPLSPLQWILFFTSSSLFFYLLKWPVEGLFKREDYAI